MKSLGGELSARGHKVTVITSTSSPSQRRQYPRRQLIDGIEVLRFDVLPVPGK